MKIEFNQNGLCLKRNQVVKVRGGIGHTVRCDSGSMWLTQYGDPRDVVLDEGEAFTLDREGLALVQAFEQGAITIAQPALPVRAPRLAAFLRTAVPGAGFPRRAARA